MTKTMNERLQLLYLPERGFDQLMPLHIWVGADERILNVGPTFQKIWGDDTVTGMPVFDVIELRRPQIEESLTAILAQEANRLTVGLKNGSDVAFRGTFVPASDGSGGLLNLSLGVSFNKVVTDCRLVLSDFSYCDQTLDLLYLAEANAAIARENRNLTERLEQAKQAAEAQALTDSLTGLSNRRAMDAHLKSLTEPQNPRFGLMHIDLDFFKEINDTHGHAAGDHMLAHAAKIFRSEVRATDIVARIGGDEFVILLRECDDPSLMEGIANRLIARLEEPIEFAGQSCRVSASAGSVLSTQYDQADPDKMLNDADLALYASKNRGRAQHTFFNESLLAPISGSLQTH